MGILAQELWDFRGIGILPVIKRFHGRWNVFATFVALSDRQDAYPTFLDAHVTEPFGNKSHYREHKPVNRKDQPPVSTDSKRQLINPIGNPTIPNQQMKQEYKQQPDDCDRTPSGQFIGLG